MKRLLDQTHDTVEIFHYDAMDDRMAIETRQDCTEIVKTAQGLKDETPEQEMRHVGFIPFSVLEQATREGWIHDKAQWKQWLNDPDNKMFRTWEGRV